MRELLSKITVRAPGEAGPGVGGCLIERLLEELRQGQPVVCVERKRLLQWNANDLTREILRINGGDHLGKDRDAIDFIAMNRGAKIHTWSGPCAVYEYEGNRNLRAIWQLSERN
jgi:hypothetical protein